MMHVSFQTYLEKAETTHRTVLDQMKAHVKTLLDPYQNGVLLDEPLIRENDEFKVSLNKYIPGAGLAGQVLQKEDKMSFESNGMTVDMLDANLLLQLCTQLEKQEFSLL